MTLDDRFSRAKTELQEMITETEVPPATDVRRRHVRRRAVQGIVGVAAAALLVLGTIAVFGDDDSDDNNGVVVTTPSTTVNESRLLVGEWGVAHVFDTAGAEMAFGPAASLSFGPDTTPCDVTRDAAGELTTLTGTCTTVRVNDGCNQGDGTVSFDAETLTFGPFRMTQKFCEFPPPVVFGENPIAWTIVGDVLTLTAADGHRVELTAAGAPPSPTTGPNPTTAPTTPTTAPTTDASFPPARTDLTHGGDTWAVVLAGSDDPTSPALAEAEDQARAAGYVTGPTGCDMGAADALGLTSTGEVLTVSVYFDSEPDARQAQAAFAALGQPGGVVAQVQTYCLD